jgi:NADH-quinone oxidoreductase subunit L
MHLVPTPPTVVHSAEAAHETALHATAGQLIAEAPTDVKGSEAVHEAGQSSGEGHASGEGHGAEYADPRQAEIMHASHAAHYQAIMISTIMVAVGIGFALIVYAFRFIDPDRTAKSIRPLYLYSYNKWYWDEIYDATVIKGSVLLSKVLAWIDTNIVDGIVNGVATLTRNFAFANGSFDKYVVDGAVNFTAFFVQTSGAVMRKIQTGKVQTYLVLVMVSVLGYFAYYLVQLMK